MVKKTIGKNKQAAAMKRRLDRARAKSTRAEARALQPKQRWF